MQHYVQDSNISFYFQTKKKRSLYNAILWKALEMLTHLSQSQRLKHGYCYIYVIWILRLFFYLTSVLSFLFGNMDAVEGERLMKNMGEKWESYCSPNKNEKLIP